MTLLETIREPAQIHGLTPEQLETLAGELREKMIRTVHKTGGHLASSLGAVELTLALHRVMDSPRDRLVWDTGHQAYAHKLLTGRWDRFDTLRQLGGIGGFPRRSESEHDVFDGGHAGTGPTSDLDLRQLADALDVGTQHADGVVTRWNSRVHSIGRLFARIAATLAYGEGLQAHARSAEYRLKGK